MRVGSHSLKSVLNTILVYYMQTNIIPNSVCENLDKIFINFIWGSIEEGKGTHLIAWEELCKPKNVGGLGLRRAKHMNQGLLMKVGWVLIRKKRLVIG